MNGVARRYWTEMLDLRAPLQDDRGKRARSRRKLVRRINTRRPPRIELP